MIFPADLRGPNTVISWWLFPSEGKQICLRPFGIHQEGVCSQKTHLRLLKQANCHVSGKRRLFSFKFPSFHHTNKLYREIIEPCGAPCSWDLELIEAPLITASDLPSKYETKVPSAETSNPLHWTFLGVFYGKTHERLCSDLTWLGKNRECVPKSLQIYWYYQRKRSQFRVTSSKTMLSQQKQIVPVKNVDQLNSHQSFKTGRLKHKKYPISFS